MRHLIIDSYNIIHAWPELKAKLKLGHAVVRDFLLSSVRILHDFEGIRLTFVFDGRGRKTTIEAPEKGNLIGMVFTASHISADAMIEHIVQKTVSPASTYVATQDYELIKHITQLGALAMSPQDLKERILGCNRRQKQIIYYHSNTSKHLFK
jgi:predicted RNA-binding protein with PIN domain